MCLSETWLRRKDLCLIDTVIQQDLVLNTHQWRVLAKSGMGSVDSDYCGRSFGGVTVICKELVNVTFCELETKSDRIMSISVCDSSGNTIEIIINVYIRYFSSNNLMQTEQFLSTIDTLQRVVDKHGSSIPITIW